LPFDFHSDGFTHLKSAISEDLSSLLTQYCFALASEGKRYRFDDEFPNSLSIYSDPLMLSLSIQLRPLIEKETGCELIPTFAFTRIYQKGAKVFEHKDREEGEIAVLMTLGSSNEERWPIFVRKNDEAVAIDLMPGDLLIYRGQEIPHWRDPFPGDSYISNLVFYVDKHGEYADRKFDNKEYEFIEQPWATVKKYYKKHQAMAELAISAGIKNIPSR